MSVENNIPQIGVTFVYCWIFVSYDINIYGTLNLDCTVTAHNKPYYMTTLDLDCTVTAHN